jgi:hypothetical protein
MAPRKKKAPKVVEEGASVSTRDDFSETTKIELLVRAANLCSRCRVFTIGSTDAGDRKNSIGVAAHICAAASGPGAKRYDPNQTKAQRRHFDNGIWMCYSCSKLIDNEETFHTAAHLKEMKARHQVYVSSLVGVVPMAPFEARSEIRAGILEATHFLITKQGVPTNFNISAVVDGYEESINALDPNFKVMVTSTSSHTLHEITPTGTATPDVKMVFPRDNYAGAAAAWKAMVEMGDDLKLSTNDFKFRGSPLFESLNGLALNGEITISRKKKTFESTVYFVAGDEVFELGSGDVVMTDGTKKFEIEGNLLGGFFSYKYSGLIGSGLKATYSYNQSAWRGQPFQSIKHYHRIKKAYDFLVVHPEAEIDIEVYANGGSITLWRFGRQDYTILHDRLKSIVELTDMLIAISRKFNEVLYFKAAEILGRDVELLAACVELLDGPINIKPSVGGHIFSVPIGEDDRARLETFTFAVDDSPALLTLKPVINLFGNWVSLPKITRSYSAYDLSYLSTIDSDVESSIYCVASTNDKTEFSSFLDPDGEFILLDEADLDLVGESE